MSAFFRIKSFLSYWLNAVDEHSLHSPFFFDLYTSQIKPSAGSPSFPHIEALRQKLLRDERAIDIHDFGVKEKENSRRKISDIARTSLSTLRFSCLYLGLANYFDATSIIELGTCLGINTLYLAEKRDAVITTFEGSVAMADIATLTFQFALKENVRVVVGNIDHTLPAYLQHVKRIDLAFMDANHRYEPTVQYFDWLVAKVHSKSVIILDDIHYSPEMTAAWNAIKNHRLVYASADLFRCGIVFFDPSLNKQHVILQV